jgi:hypothetical protein
MRLVFVVLAIAALVSGTSATGAKAHHHHARVVIHPYDANPATQAW